MSNQQDKRSAGPLAWCLLAAGLFGAATPASKPLLSILSPVLLSGVLYVGAAIGTAPWAMRNLGSLRRANRRNVKCLAAAVFFGGVAGPVLLLTGLAMAPAGSVSLWLNLETVATALLAWFFFKEHLGASTWVSVVLIVVASALLSPTTHGGGAAALFVSLACVAWALDNNFTAVIDRFSPAQVTFAKGLVAGVVNGTIGLVLVGNQPALWAIGLGLLVGILGYGASLLLHIAGAQQLGATRAQLIFSTAPAWGLVLAWVALGEAIEPLQIGAAALMALALWLWYREHHEHAHAHDLVTHTHWHRHDDDHHEHEHATAVSPGTWHSHEHTHEAVEHAHPHRPDLHHRHAH